MLIKKSIRPARKVLALCALGTAAWAMAAPPYEEWGTPVNLASLPGSAPNINSPAVDGCVSLSRDGLELYFTSFRDGSADVFVAERTDTSKGFGSVRKLPGTINTPGANEACPTIIGRNTLHFLRSEGQDQGNLWVSRRTSGDWQEAAPYRRDLATPLLEESVSIFENEQGQEVMIFSRRNPDGSNGVILQSVAGGPAVPVAGGPNAVGGDPKASGSNNRPWVSRNGLMIAFDSTRPGGQGGPDIWFAERDSTSEPFGEAYTLPELNSPFNDLRPAFTWDGTQMFFSSSRAGSTPTPGLPVLLPDTWVVERARRKGPKMIEFPSGE